MTVECEACGGAGKIVEEARTQGANQHSACQMDCEECDGSGRLARPPSVSADPVGGVTSGAGEGRCRVPPQGWQCTRVVGHEGPCAAVSERETPDFLAQADFGHLKTMWDAMATDQESEGTVVVETSRGPVDVDTTVAPLVRALVSIGVETVASCSGHGHRPGNIALRDGREIIIARGYEEARRIDRLFPISSSGELIDPRHTEGSDVSYQRNKAARQREKRLREEVGRLEEAVRWAKGLIVQLPKDHDGRNSWMMNYSARRRFNPLANAQKGQAHE